MSRERALWIAVLLLTAGAAQAQDGLGLDLTQPEEEKKEEAPAEEAAPAPDVPVLEEPPVTKPSEPLLGEREITQDDRVKSVQRKVYLKRHRFELAPYISFSVNDPYYSKFGGYLRGAYYLADTLAIAGRASIYQVLPSTDVRLAKQTFSSQIYYSIPEWSLMADVEWSPIYGKVSFLNSILHFDAYVLGGIGLVNTVSASRVVNGRALGAQPGADLGGGLRFIAKDYLAINVSLINTSYVDQPTNTTKGALQNVTTLNAGVSIFFPFSSTGREAE